MRPPGLNVHFLELYGSVLSMRVQSVSARTSSEPAGTDGASFTDWRHTVAGNTNPACGDCMVTWCRMGKDRVLKVGRWPYSLKADYPCFKSSVTGMEND